MYFSSVLKILLYAPKSCNARFFSGTNSYDSCNYMYVFDLKYEKSVCFIDNLVLRYAAMFSLIQIHINAVR